MDTISTDVVHEALLLLYLPKELAECQLARCLPEASALADGLARAQAVRGKLLDVIAALRPSPRSGPPAAAGRAYECLKLRYVSGFSVEDVARKLSMSERQVYRDLRFAEERLAFLLQSQAVSMPANGAPVAASQPETSDALLAEIRALAHRPEAVNLGELVGAAIATVSRLADKQGLRIALVRPKDPVITAVTPAVLRGLITQILSALLQSQPARDITMRLLVGEKSVSLEIPVGEPDRLTKRELLESALRVASAQGIAHSVVPREGGSAVRIELPLAKRRRVLVVEDNPGACALYERYLANSEWEAVRSPHPRLVTSMLASKQAEVVVLDIMMAEADGWDVLQALKADPRTRGVPVVICSVVNDPELGAALGAAAYLTKPVSRLDLLKTLRSVTRERRQA